MNDAEAHQAQDSLLADFVRDIAQSGSSYAKRSQLVLTVFDFDFSRWYE